MQSGLGAVCDLRDDRNQYIHRFRVDLIVHAIGDLPTTPRLGSAIVPAEGWGGSDIGMMMDEVGYTSTGAVR